MKSKIVWVVVTLVLGALGSGLWELALRPALAFFGSAALDIVTLGLDSARNALYADAAHGQFERAAISMMAAGAGIVAGITTVVLFGRSLRSRLRQSAPQEAPKRSFVLTLLLVFTTTMVLLLFYRVAYINRAANYVDQLSQIIAPYQTERERLLVRSQFAQVVTRDEYVKLVESLRATAASHALKVPEFTIY
jgi:hypothetical protein